jgi:Ras-related protein Rab-6A
MPPAVHRVIVLGDSAVGKTSIINQFIYGAVQAQHQPTVGIDFFSKTLIAGDSQVRLQIWDTAGQERFHSLIPSYIRDATVAVLVYDITSQSTFESVKGWHQRTLDLASPAFAVVGNKVDLEGARAVAGAEARAYAESIGALFFETSAATALHVAELFDRIVAIPTAVAPAAGDQQPEVPKVNLDEIAPPPKGRCSC